MTFDAQMLAEICAALSDADTTRAKEIAERKIPFQPFETESRKYSDVDALKVYIRDGFIDRYTGDKLVFPGALRLLSDILPEQIPYHPNWKTTECHMLFWFLSPSVDHLIPIARGGPDDDSNWVCTSMFRNQIKSHWTLDELEWSLHDPGDIKIWDGLLGWYMKSINQYQEFKDDAYHRRWQRASRRVLDAA